MDVADVVVVGGGLAGSEAAWQAAERGCRVHLYEMRPERSTDAHQTGRLAELVCSNSFKSEAETTGSGLLKRELRALGAKLLTIADTTRVPAGSALAVDRQRFSEAVEAALEAHPRISIDRRELTQLPPEVPGVIASGPLTSPGLAAHLSARIGTDALYFFDAIAPVVDADSINLSVVFAESRYGRGEADYLNCPLQETEYYALREALIAAELAPVKDFDRTRLFEACLPIEELARRGPLTMAFGPLKPVGLTDPRTGRRPFAVCQLRAENLARTMYGLVGFQTRLKYGEQKRVLRVIPGLERAEFLRLGSMHKNAFVDAPTVLDPTLQVRRAPSLLIAGQLTGAEGYVEAQATGFLAGVNLARLARGAAPLALPPATALGALTHFLATAPGRPFQPMNFNFGLLPPIELRGRSAKRQRKLALGARAQAELTAFCQRHPDLSTAVAAAASM